MLQGINVNNPKHQWLQAIKIPKNTLELLQLITSLRLLLLFGFKFKKKPKEKQEIYTIPKFWRKGKVMDIWLCEEGFKNSHYSKFSGSIPTLNWCIFWDLKGGSCKAHPEGIQEMSQWDPNGFSWLLFYLLMAVYGLSRISDPWRQPQSAVMAPKLTIWGLKFVGEEEKLLSQDSLGKKKAERREICSQQKLSESLFQDLTLGVPCSNHPELREWRKKRVLRALRWIPGLWD